MNFLNEISSQYPSAISLAAGRPAEQFFGRIHNEALLEALTRFERHVAGDRTSAQVRAWLLQYGRTAGIINDLVARQLRVDEGVPATPDRVLITAGCQEALALCLPALCPDPSDVLLVCNPTYIGATGAAHASGVAVSGLPAIACLPEAIDQVVAQLHKRGQQARALYLIPDFDNPTGRILDESQRRAILSACARHRIVVLEDNPYGLFRYEGEPIQPMAALDEVGCVIYLSTFSKTLSPAMRVGAATLPDTLFGDRAASKALFQKLVQRKSFVSVNTSQITQAIVGGILLDQNSSLQHWVQPSVEWYRNNRDTMLSELQTVFAPYSDQVRWSRPYGGFFLTLDLPFIFDANCVAECATNYGVIVMPMSFFALDTSQDSRIRLAFSSVTPSQIGAGIAALSRFVAQHMRRKMPGTEMPHVACRA
jgi:(S)-3,5-dihydroxyphenylglycine transaminase